MYPLTIDKDKYVANYKKKHTTLTGQYDELCTQIKERNSTLCDINICEAFHKGKKIGYKLELIEVKNDSKETVVRHYLDIPKNISINEINKNGVPVFNLDCEQITQPYQFKFDQIHV